MVPENYTQTEADKDAAKLADFHEDAYNGYSHTEAQIKQEHERWWRLAEYYKGLKQAPPLEVMLTLLYTMKYLPQTYTEAK